MRWKSANRGQAIIEYILVIAMVAVVVATTIRGASHTLFEYWTAIAVNIALPCPTAEGGGAGCTYPETIPAAP